MVSTNNLSHVSESGRRKILLLMVLSHHKFSLELIEVSRKLDACLSSRTESVYISGDIFYTTV